MKDKRQIFKSYLNPIFFETGSYDGNGIKHALEYGFETIISIELHPAWFEQCRLKYGGNNVELYLGDSEDLMPLILKTIDRPCTFWLDAHYSGEGTGNGKHSVPILQELDFIKAHSEQTGIIHTILIDDIRYFRKGWDNVKLQNLIDKVMEINSNYKISFADSWMGGKNGVIDLPNDILIAHVRV